MCADDTIGNNIIIITRKLWVMDHGSRGSPVTSRFKCNCLYSL